MKRMFDQYIKKAKNDFLSIKNNLASDEIPADTCCFHAQQAAEKYLKAYLDYNNLEIPKIHDLVKLMKLCMNINPDFVALEPKLKLLSEYSVTPRYPDEKDDITVEDAKIAYQTSLAVKEFIEKNFFH
ncbi:MAG: HEPN domain-containing protein [Chitinophagaceae bacterium]|nr:MAG: HEPN domain-containing protein [Chitinophagaceae bacterium]